MGRAGRRPQDDTGDTRTAIQAAALEQFSERGYQATTIRSIAEQAQVDAALVLYFFGSKERLFEACVEWPFDLDEEIAAVMAAGVDRAGEGLVRLFVTTWDARGGRNTSLALLRAAMGQESAERLLREFLQAGVLMPLLAAFGVKDPVLRAGLIASQLLGLGAARYLLRLDGLTSLPADQLVACVGPTIQRYLNGPVSLGG